MLYVVATPIGHPDDLSPRARKILSSANAVIGEEWKELKQLLRLASATPKELYVLNEHSKKEDLQEFVELCRHKTVALVSDCGTPAFCDPGADLVKACQKENIKVHSIPGPSSLSTFISLCGVRLDQFLFRGFLPPRGDERIQALQELKSLNLAVVLMDTPYRLKRLLEDLKEHLGERRITLGLNLSMENEQILKGTAAQVLKILTVDKAEFMLLLDPVETAQPKRSRKISRKK